LPPVSSSMSCAAMAMRPVTCPSRCGSLLVAHWYENRGLADMYVWKGVVWDKAFGLGSSDALSGDVAQWAMIVLTAYFGGRSLDKVARILGRK
jgi:hypothetical protein